MSDEAQFDDECRENAKRMATDQPLHERSVGWICDTARYRYTYNFRWLGLPVIQFPQDLLALQEILWRVRPELVIETGVARGGSLVFHASILELLGNEGLVLGVDVDIRSHNRRAIESHPLARRIRLIEGSSVATATLAEVSQVARDRRRVVVILDSSHTHDHVLAELRAYSPFVSPGSYVAVMDTIIEDMPKEHFPDRPWGPGDNPRTAVRAFLDENPDFQPDQELQDKLLITVAPGGYLRRLR